MAETRHLVLTPKLYARLNNRMRELSNEHPGDPELRRFAQLVANMKRVYAVTREDIDRLVTASQTLLVALQSQDPQEHEKAASVFCEIVEPYEAYDDGDFSQTCQRAKQGVRGQDLMHRVQAVSMFVGELREFRWGAT